MPLPKYKLALFGRFQISGPNGPIELPNRKLEALLAYLACTASKPRSREKIATLLWGSRSEPQARQSLRQALFRLRRALGQDALIGNDDEILLAPGMVDCDAARLEALIREGSQASLAEAVDLYKGPLLADVDIAEETWTEWMAGERQRLEGIALDALVELGQIDLGLGNAARALESARRAVAIDQLREDAHRLIVQALAAAGRKAEALKHYKELVALLKRELNTGPDAATESLVAKLGSSQAPAIPSAATAIATPATSLAAPPQHQPSPEAAPPLAVVEKEPEQRQLTILAFNLLGLAPLASNLDPEEMDQLIVDFQRRAAEAVAPFDGYVAQRLADGVLVYFGYPAAHEDDAEQAVRAAFSILKLTGTLKARADMRLQASAGIATGLVVVGGEPSPGEPRQPAAIGEAVSQAALLQAAAAPGEILIADTTRRLVGRRFDYDVFPAIAVNGPAQTAEAWQVRGEAAGVSRFEARRAGMLSPLVGRQEEIDLLLRRWDQVKLGEGRVVLLSGEPGIGKSRVAESFLLMLAGESRLRQRYLCSPHHAHSPLYPFIAQFEQEAGIEPGDSAAAKLDKLEALLKTTSKDLARDAALLADLLSIPTDERYPALTFGPQQKREMTLVALLDQLDAAAAQGRVLIVLEDAHWIDPTSLDLLDRMVARVADLPALLIVTFRPEFEPSWVGQPHVAMLPLSRLDRRDSARIIGSIAQEKALPDAVIAQILAHTDGVPLFIEELTRTMLESGVLREMPGSYVLDGPLPPLAVPMTLQASLVARLDRLASPKHVAQIGAAIGREFPHALMAAVSTLAPAELDAALAQLTASGLILRRGTPPDATYSFKHTLVRDAAYMTMLKSRRRQLHASIARALIEPFPAMAGSLPEVIAQHFTAAGLAGEAIDYWAKAGRLAYARGANREAVEFFEQALSAVASLPEGRSTLEQAVDMRLELQQALIQLREVPRALERLREAEPLAERLNDDRRRCRLFNFEAITYALIGDLDVALVAGTRALELARRLGDLRLGIPATTILQQVHFYRGEHESVVALARVNLAALPADLASEDFGLATTPSVYDRGRMIISLAELGRFEEAAKLEAEALQLVARTQHAYSIGWANLAPSWAHMLKGDWALARPRLERATEVLSAGNIVLLIPMAIGLFAWNLAQLGELDEAQSKLREGEQRLGRHAEGGMSGILGWFYPWLGRAALALGRPDHARRLGERALESSPRQPGFAAHALHLLGDIASHPDQFDAERAEAYYREVLAIAVPRGMRPLVAHCHLGLGRLCRHAGKRPESQEHFASAAAMYREMNMRFFLGQAETGLKQPQSPQRQ